MIIQSFILYTSYLIFPFLAFLIYWNWKHRSTLKKKEICLVSLGILYLITGLFIYARFIERYQIKIQTTQIETGFESKLIVISDMHLGAYKDESFLKRVVEKVNQQENIDAVLIPGDFTNYPHQDLTDLFTPLQDLKFPTFAVLGNHDSEKPGPYLRDELKEVLESYGVIFLHNQSTQIPNTQIQVLGLGAHLASEDDLSLINQFKKEDDLIVLTHNPDSTLAYQDDRADLTVTGHTHGGQIRIPWLYNYIIPTHGDFDQGLYKLPAGGTLFITSGLGEVGLPMRLGIPPVIDILITK